MTCLMYNPVFFLPADDTNIHKVYKQLLRVRSWLEINKLALEKTNEHTEKTNFVIYRSTRKKECD